MMATKHKIALLFPGQGAQYPEMTKDFCEKFAISRHTMQEADDLLENTFSRWMWQASPEELAQTKHSQLAIFMSSIAIWRAVAEQLPDLEPKVCAGLSLGEYTALVAAGYLTFAQAIHLVDHRARYMQEACEQFPGGMRVVLGMNGKDVVECLTSFSNVWAANFNCPGQVVIAGKQDALEHATTFLKNHGAKRILPLDVGGAFHTPLMASAANRLEPLLMETIFQQGSIPVVMNVTGDVVEDREAMRKHLIDQITSPVLWEQGMRTMEKKKMGEMYLEIGPGKTLSAMHRKMDLAFPLFSINRVEDLEEFYAKLSYTL